MDDEIWKVFTSETLEITDALEKSILDYERSRDPEALGHAYHQIHSIKGSLGIICFDRLGGMVHKTEDLFQDCRKKPFTQIKTFVRIVFGIIDYVRQVIAEENEDSINKEIISDFQELLNQDLYAEEEWNQTAPVQQQTSKVEKKLLRIDSEKLDELLDLMGELITAGDSFRQLSEEISDSRLGNKTSLLLNLIEQLSEKTLEMRMIPLSSVMNRFNRTVHDLAEETGKQVNLKISGEQTEVDKTIAEKIVDPLTHLVRNCIDHGLDFPEAREEQGKPASGTIHLNARYDNDFILINISDDGKGLDYKKIREKASKIPEWSGIEAEEELADLIFEPGFSTADSVSAISGRGMGMPAVRDSIQNLRGSISIISKEGEGTEFRMKLPLSLALIEGLLIRMNESFYIIPSEDIQECIALQEGDIDQSTNVTTMNWNERVLSLINLKRVMNQTGNANNIVVVNYQNDKIGILCDEVITTIRTVTKPLHPFFQNQPWLQGSSVLGTGEPVLILNMAGLIDQFRV